MPPLLQEAIGAIFRHFFTIVAGYLVARGIWTGEKGEMYAAAGAAAAVGLGWSLYQKYWQKVYLLIAAALDRKTTVAEIKEIAKNDNANPSVNTPETHTPKMSDPIAKETK